MTEIKAVEKKEFTLEVLARTNKMGHLESVRVWTGNEITKSIKVVNSEYVTHLEQKCAEYESELFTISCATLFDGMIQKENAIAAKKVLERWGK